MSNKNIVSTVLDNLATHRAERQQRDQLAQELASFATPADRLELDLIMSRYPDEQTAELREILGRQSALAA